MKPDFNFKRVTLLVLLLTQVAFGAIAKDLNMIDASGFRQGYWIIKGYMANDRQYTPDATVEEGNYKDNRKEGLWKKYWPNGKMKSEINYSTGRPDGEYKVYYENGTMEEHANWQNGKNIGQFMRYYDDGKPQQVFSFADNGKRNGIQKYYHDNGIVAMEVNIINGAESGVLKRYNTDGTLNEESTFNNGALKPGSIKEYSGQPADVFATDPYNEEIGKESVEVQDKPNEASLFKSNGYNVLYEKNNQISQVGQFKNGRLWDGKWYRYSSDGILIRVEIYKQGRYIGTGILAEEGQ